VKIRNDFITNSSSSSFILAFKDEDSIYSTLKEQFPDNIEESWSAGDTGYFQQLLNEIEDADRLTEDDLAEIFKTYEKCSIKWETEEELESHKNMSYGEVCTYLKTEDGKKLLENAYKEKLDSFLAAIGNNKVVVKVKHGSGGDGEDGVLETKILPHLGCTIKQFSHH
jgi:hypothetical protein